MLPTTDTTFPSPFDSISRDRLVTPSPPPSPCCACPCPPPHDPLLPTPPKPAQILSSPIPFHTATTGIPAKLSTFSCAHTSPPTSLPLIDRQRCGRLSNPSAALSAPPKTFPHACINCATVLVQTQINNSHSARDGAIAELEGQIEKARKEIWVGGGGPSVGGGEGILMAEYLKAHERLRMWLVDRDREVWEAKTGWESVWGRWEGRRESLAER